MMSNATHKFTSLLPNMGNEDFKPSSYPASSPARNNLSSSGCTVISLAISLHPVTAE